MAGKHRATKNFIINPSDGRKIYFLADGPHLLKNINNCLVQNKSIQLSPYFVEKYKLPSNLVKIEHIKTFCDEEETVDLKFAPKLSVDLLNTGHFNKMKVSHALNVLNWKMRKQKICQDCMLALGSKTKRITIRPYSKFVALKEYKAGCLFYVTDKTFQTAILVEKAFSN
jgi:hypothetical protein